MNIDLNTLQGITFDGHDVQGLVYNGVTLWSKGGGSPTPSYTELKSISYNSTSVNPWTYQYFNTGINTNVGASTPTWEIRVKLNCKGNEGNVCIGHKGGSTPGSGDKDSRDFRLFFESYLFIDVGNGRSYYNSHPTSNYSGRWSDFTWLIDWNQKGYILKNTGASRNIYNGSFNYYPNNCPVFISTAPMYFQSCSIKQGDTMIFDGVAALDSNNRPCIYDKVSGSFIYAQGTYSADSNFAIEYFS